MKTVDFSEACDLKVGRCRQLFELMKVWKVKVISWPWPQSIYLWNLKLVFLRNYLASFDQGNENQWMWCWSHDPRWLLCPFMVKTPLKNLLLLNRLTDFHETWNEASGTLAHHCLFKWWPWLTLTYFTARSNLILWLFYRKKWKPWVFQKLLKHVTWNRQLIELMKVWKVKVIS